MDAPQPQPIEIGLGEREAEGIYANLVFILVAMPLLATLVGWLLAGREPLALSRQPME